MFYIGRANIKKSCSKKENLQKLQDKEPLKLSSSNGRAGIKL